MLAIANRDHGPWAHASGFAACSVVVAASLLSGCDGSSKEEEVSAVLDASVASLLVVTDAEGSIVAGDIDVGVFDLRRGIRIERRLVVENTCERSVSIVDIWKSCGCASVKVDRPEIRPGERANVEIVVSPIAGGPFDVDAALILDDESALKLGVRGVARETDRLSAHHNAGLIAAGTKKPLLVVVRRSGVGRSELPGPLSVRSCDGLVSTSHQLSEWREVATDPNADSSLWMTEIELSAPTEQGVHFMTIALGDSLTDVVRLHVVKERR